MRLTLATPYLAISASNAVAIDGCVLSASISTASFLVGSAMTLLRLPALHPRLDELGHALDLRTERGELALDVLVAAVHVIDAVDEGLAVGGERRDHQRRRCTQIGRHDRRRLQALAAGDHRGIAFDADVCAEPQQFLRVDRRSVG